MEVKNKELLELAKLIKRTVLGKISKNADYVEDGPNRCRLKLDATNFDLKLLKELGEIIDKLKSAELINKGTDFNLSGEGKLEVVSKNFVADLSTLCGHVAGLGVAKSAVSDLLEAFKTSINSRGK